MYENRSNVMPSILIGKKALAFINEFCLDLMAEVLHDG